MGARDDMIGKLARYLFYDSMNMTGHMGDITWSHVSTTIHLYWTGKAERLLNMNPELAIVDRSADLPEARMHPPEGVLIRFIQDMRKEGWVKEVREN